MHDGMANWFFCLPNKLIEGAIRLAKLLPCECHPNEISLR